MGTLKEELEIWKASRYKEPMNLKKMKINISLIESESLSKLKTELKKLDVEWN